MATPETIKNIKVHLSTYGLSEKDLERVDPYKWGGHWQRTLLWIARGHLKIVTPLDTEGQQRMLTDSSFQDGVGWAMRSFERGDRKKGLNQLKELNLEVISEPHTSN